MFATPPVVRVSNARRIFIGGIPIKMDERVLKDYFARFGPVSYFKMAKNKKNKEPLGFGFLEFKDDATSQEVLATKHYIDGREIDVKPFKKGTEINKQDEDLKKRKLFVKGLPSSCTNKKLQTAFEQFGPVDKAFILFDHSNGASRGFGFVEFFSEEIVSKALSVPVTIDGKTIKCSPAILKQESKNSTAETKKSKPSVTSNHDEDTLPPNKTSKEFKTKKSHQLKSINLKDDNYPEDEVTKESSDNNSFDRYSKENFGSPFAYSGYSFQEFNYPHHDFKFAESPMTFFPLPLQQQNLAVDPYQSSFHPFLRSVTYPSKQDLTTTHKFDSSSAAAQRHQGGASRPQPSTEDSLRLPQTKKKPSYYKMF